MSEIRPNESASNASSSVSTQRPKSIVWDHFKVSEADKTKAICSHCPKRKNEFSYNNYGTKNLIKHLKTQHAFVFADPDQPRVNEALFQKAFSQDIFDQYLLEWVVTEDQPFNQLESKEFIRILNSTQTELKNH
jgi:hypothetical protein